MSRVVGKISSITSIDIRRKLLIVALIGLSREVLDGHARRYIKAQLPHNVSTEVKAAICSVSSKGGKVYLATASLEPIAEAAVGEFELDGYISSQLKYDEKNLCQGFLCVDVVGSKWNYLKQNIDLSKQSKLLFYTDNTEDVDVMEKVDFTYFIGKKGMDDVLTSYPALSSKITFI